MLKLRRFTRYDRTVTMRLTRDQVKRLGALAQHEQRPVSELLRHAVEELLAATEPKAAG